MELPANLPRRSSNALGDREQGTAKAKQPKAKHKILRLRSLHPKNQHRVLGDPASHALVKANIKHKVLRLRSGWRAGTLLRSGCGEPRGQEESGDRVIGSSGEVSSQQQPQGRTPVRLRSGQAPVTHSALLRAG